MSTGDSIKAGKITTANAITDLVAEIQWENYHPHDYAGQAILRVGPSITRNETPDAILTGIQGIGLFGGTGVVGLGGAAIDARNTGTGVLGVGGQPTESAPEGIGGVGVKGVAGGAADGVVGTTDSHFKSGVFGFNSLSLKIRDVAGFGVFGRCDTAGGAGVGAESAYGVGVRAHSAGNDGVVGLSDAESKSGVYGFNSRAEGTAYGVFGRSDANGGAGVGAASKLGNAVRGHSDFNDAVVGVANAPNKSGVFGLSNSGHGVTRGVFGRADSIQGIGVGGVSDHGYGASFRGGLAPLRLEPASTKGAPATGAHQMGELFLDNVGDLYLCKSDGVGSAAKWVKIA